MLAIGSGKKFPIHALLLLAKSVRLGIVPRLVPGDLGLRLKATRHTRLEPAGSGPFAKFKAAGGGSSAGFLALIPWIL